jgi:hypothetical protein
LDPDPRASFRRRFHAYNVATGGERVGKSYRFLHHLIVCGICIAGHARFLARWHEACNLMHRRRRATAIRPPAARSRPCVCEAGRATYGILLARRTLSPMQSPLAPVDDAVRQQRAATPPLRLPVHTLPQPDETTCGPTCLHAIYRYWGEEALLTDVIARMHRLEQGGTFAVFLGCDALRHGYRAAIYTYNVTVFDPTWFTQPGIDIADRLARQRDAKSDFRLQSVTEGYLEFLRRGGRLRLADLSAALVRGLLRFKLPIITGLSSTYLYRARREYGPNDTPDDVRGMPVGHFVVIAGHDEVRRRVLVVDPYQPNPYGRSHE